MSFEDWPDIHADCPICARSGCAIYRGYYSRFLFCTELEFSGLLVIRTGYCKSNKIRFSVLPDFVLRRRRISRFSYERLREARAAHSNLLSAIDELTSDLGEEFFLSVSTAHSYLKFDIANPPPSISLF